MITLWVIPSGLRSSTDPDNPQLTDIRMTSKLAELADIVILQTAHAAFIRKDRDKDFAPRKWDGEEWTVSPKDFCAVFNGSAVTSDPNFPWPPLNDDLAKFREMQDVVNDAP